MLTSVSQSRFSILYLRSRSAHAEGGWKVLLNTMSFSSSTFSAKRSFSCDKAGGAGERVLNVMSASSLAQSREPLIRNVRKRGGGGGGGSARASSIMNHPPACRHTLMLEPQDPVNPFCVSTPRYAAVGLFIALERTIIVDWRCDSSTAVSRRPFAANTRIWSWHKSTSGSCAHGVVDIQIQPPRIFPSPENAPSTPLAESRRFSPALQHEAIVITIAKPLHLQAWDSPHHVVMFMFML